MADANRLMALSMVPPLAEEVANQMDAGAVPAELAAALATPAAYSETPADISAVLVAAGLMEPDA